VERVCLCFDQLGWGVRAVTASDLAGPRGNREIFLLAGPGTGLAPEERSARIAEEVHREPA
jgi:hypothetical protein